jgi:purine-cytosine permease-like protein
VRPKAGWYNQPIDCSAHGGETYRPYSKRIIIIITIIIIRLVKTNDTHFLHLIYYKLTAYIYICFERYLLIFRSRYTNKTWYIGCVLCLLVVTSVGVEEFHSSSTPIMVATNGQT